MGYHSWVQARPRPSFLCPFDFVLWAAAEITRGRHGTADTSSIGDFLLFFLFLITSTPCRHTLSHFPDDRRGTYSLPCRRVSRGPSFTPFACPCTQVTRLFGCGPGNLAIVLLANVLFCTCGCTETVVLQSFLQHGTYHLYLGYTTRQQYMRTIRTYPVDACRLCMTATLDLLPSLSKTSPNLALFTLVLYCVKEGVAASMEIYAVRPSSV